jgi:hypothetical protein
MDLVSSDSVSYRRPQTPCPEIPVPAFRFRPTSLAILAPGSTHHSPIPWASVTITGKNVAPSSLSITEQVRTDGNGQLFLPKGFTTGQYVMDLKFLGDGAITPSTAKFEVTVN